MADTKSGITLRVLTPNGVFAETECDAVTLTVADNENGKGGGSIGILRGHLPGIFALAPGEVRYRIGDKGTLCCTVKGGFASLRDDVLTILTDSIE